MNILIADDHDIFRQSLALLLASQGGYHVTGNVGSFNDLLECLSETVPDCVILDYHMPGGQPVQITERLRRQYPDLRIAMLTGSQSCNVLKQLYDCPVDAVLHKKDNADTIMMAMTSIARGERFISAMVDSMIRQTEVDLTQRELQVLELLLNGRTPPQIAVMLAISPRTVEKHKENLMKKLGANNTMELLEAGHRLVACE